MSIRLNSAQIYTQPINIERTFATAAKLSDAIDSDRMRRLASSMSREGAESSSEGVSLSTRARSLLTRSALGDALVVSADTRVVSEADQGFGFGTYNNLARSIFGLDQK